MREYEPNLLLSKTFSSTNSTVDFEFPCNKYNSYELWPVGADLIVTK